MLLNNGCLLSNDVKSNNYDFYFVLIYSTIKLNSPLLNSVKLYGIVIYGDFFGGRKMNIDPNLYTHDSDKAALEMLKSIPVFSQVLKAFMKHWNERLFVLQNLSSNLRLGENQLPKYYNMLPPICEKLGIEVPELYLSMDDGVNAYTFGDTKPFIVITTGLLESLPEELIPTVLAHECGHIACHHVLYHTMGTMLINGTLLGLSYFGLNELAIAPLKAAFFRWMRCSELSADRAAAICDGSSENIIKMCMTFAGYREKFGEECNKEAFMEQALEYKNMIDDSLGNKILEHMMFKEETHPLIVLRAYECSEWVKCDSFANIIELSNCKAITPDSSILLPIIKSSKKYIGEHYESVTNDFMQTGFSNISVTRVTESNKPTTAGKIISLTVDGNDNFEKQFWTPANSKIEITYFDEKTEEELRIEHPNEIRVINDYKHYTGVNFHTVISELEMQGFKNIECEPKYDSRIRWLVKHGNVQKISINNNYNFKKGDWFPEDAVVKIIYHSTSPSNVLSQQN